VLNKLLLQIEAGETMQRALLSAAASGRPDHALYAELMRLRRRIEQQTPLTAALEELSRRCPLKEIRLFVNALSLNYRRGGDQLTLTLRELSARLWAERQAAARILGEESSSKLLFPMMVLFLVVMGIVAAPAVLLMGNP
jgi:tight adherence protein C